MKTQIKTNYFKSMLKIMDKIKDDKLNQSTDLLIYSDYDVTNFVKSNSETTIIYNTKTYTEESGQIVLPLETAELIKKLKEGSLTISDKKINTDKKEIGFTKLDNITINTYDYIEKIFSVTQKELLRMLEVTYAVSKNDDRPVLKAIFFNKNETCALDGFRMSVRVSKEYENEASFMVNQNSIEILKSILKQNDNIVDVYYDSKENIVKFKIDNITVIAKCIEGEFIKYDYIIPREYRNKAIINPSDLLEELIFISDADKRNYVENFINENNTIIVKGNQCKEVYNQDKSYKLQEEKQGTLDMEYNDKYSKWLSQKCKADVNNKKFKTKQPEKKIAKFIKQYDLVPVNDIKSTINSINTLTKYDLYDENFFKIAYNPNYMIDSLKLYSDSDKIELRMTNSVSPIVITNDEENLELVLPVRFI